MNAQRPNLAIKPFRPDTPNWKVFEAIRNEASDDDRRRIPAATQASIEQTTRMLNTIPSAMNEFVSAIVNKVGLTIAINRNWTNRLAKFKRGMLENGAFIEEIHSGLVQAYVYDHDQDYGEKALFARERPEVQADYHAINRENFYKITVDTIALKRAFTSETGLAQFINNLMDAPTTSDNWDEYLAMRQLFAHYEENGGFFKVHIPTIPTDAEATVQARQALRLMRTYIGKLGFPSFNYSVSGMPVWADPGDLELFVTPEFQAAMDVEALAGLFNVSYAEVSSRITVIDRFPAGMEDIQAILTTPDFFVVADTLYTTTNQPNPVGLHENFFLHHHQIVSYSRFVPAIAFTYGEGTEVTEIEPDWTGIEFAVVNADGQPVTTVERGKSYEFNGSLLNGTANDVDGAIRIEVSGNNFRTYATQTVLHVSSFEDHNTITVKAVGVDDPSYTKEITLTVVGDRLVLWPNPEVLPDADADGIAERTPKEPARIGNTVTIPNVTGVQYKVDGANVANGSTHQATAAPGITVTAEARSGYELAPGSVTSWTFIATSPEN